ncbi:acyl-CoA dehydrogenase family member 11-like [Triplophysa rosa]|uniref:acyl-CoA dehydrogenase family member 11-like n=1 Tax=Triplophysa rosa TaxID=992332 RepID=UPI0025460C81|nr:acyl-CoA dehydrogenase family member 11-like [Triplophysa rosa]
MHLRIEIYFVWSCFYCCLIGIPSADDLISIYCHCRGIPKSLPQKNFFIPMAIFKMAAISQGIYARHLLGNASSANAAVLGEIVEPLAELGLQIALSRTLTVPTPDQLFLQSPNGQTVLHRIKEFMRNHVLPAQQVSTAAIWIKRAQTHYVAKSMQKPPS